MTIVLTFSLCLATSVRISAMSSPGSMTMASRVASSPRIEQLHCNIPTGRISWIIPLQCMDEVIVVLVRVVHILSVVMLLGSAFYIRFVEKGIERIPAWYIFLPVIGVIASGAYQLMDAIRAHVDKGWHITFGIKMLFVLHILAVFLLQL